MLDCSRVASGCTARVAPNQRYSSNWKDPFDLDVLSGGAPGHDREHSCPKAGREHPLRRKRRLEDGPLAGSGGRYRAMSRLFRQARDQSQWVVSRDRFLRRHQAQHRPLFRVASHDTRRSCPDQSVDPPH
jgi:hypothetical protein